MNEYGIEFSCKKGQVQNVNQDNIFIMITDSKVGLMKIIGVFDGHGPFGHKVSRYTQIQLIVQHISQNKYLKPEILAEPDMFEDVKRELIDIFLTIQDELEGRSYII